MSPDGFINAIWGAGTAIAVYLSMSSKGSILWAALHGALGWLYVLFIFAQRQGFLNF